MRLNREDHQLRRDLIKKGMDPRKAFEFVTEKARDEERNRKKGRKR